MKLLILAAATNSSISVKSLHSLLALQNKIGLTDRAKEIETDIVFIENDPFVIKETIDAELKNHDRILLIPYGYSIHTDSMDICISSFPNCHILVLPTVEKHIDWDIFRKSILEESSEPISQAGLLFNTQANKKIDDTYWTVKTFTSNLMIIECKPMLKLLKKNNVTFPLDKRKYSEFFNKYGAKIITNIKAITMTVFPHRCMGSIVNAAGIKVRRDENTTES